MSFPKYVEKGEKISAQWGNDVVSSIRRRRKAPRQKVSGSGASAPEEICPFGTVKSLSGGDVIAGGAVMAGDKTFLVEDYAPNTATARTVALYFEIPVEVNRDDDHQLLLPGVKTSSWTPEYLEAETYPDGTNPVVATGLGKIVVPLGILYIANNTIDVFEALTCGAVAIIHCAGSLSFSRGG